MRCRLEGLKGGIGESAADTWHAVDKVEKWKKSASL
jgi:hypothetical protein